MIDEIIKNQRMRYPEYWEMAMEYAVDKNLMNKAVLLDLRYVQALQNMIAGLSDQRWFNQPLTIIIIENPKKLFTICWHYISLHNKKQNFNLKKHLITISKDLPLNQPNTTLPNFMTEEEFLKRYFQGYHFKKQI